MDKLWAPWRMEYIENIEKTKGCFLCDVVSEGDDRANLVLYRGEEAYVVMNKYPYNCGHIMIASYKHTPHLLELSDACRTDLMTICGKSMEILERELGSQGFNCGANFGKIAGAGIKDHFHLHVVPRWSGDTNYFPVIGETKSVPEYLEKTYDKLAGEFSKIGE